MILELSKLLKPIKLAKMEHPESCKPKPWPDNCGKNCTLPFNIVGELAEIWREARLKVRLSLVLGQGKVTSPQIPNR